ncbi:MAG: MFS transporter [bacterium]|nr:MFS transporter [bacterium]
MKESKEMLRASLKPLIPLLIGTALIIAGNALLSTILALRGQAEGMADTFVGLWMSAYFVGYFLGSILLAGLIHEVGHIRTFSALASVASAVALLHLLLIDPFVWILLRVMVGACVAGMIMVIESWLNAGAKTEIRGRVLSVYSMVTVGSWAVSQPALNLASPEQFTLFCLVSIVLSFALVPVALARTAPPLPVAAPRMPLRKLFSVSPLGAVALPLTGTLNGAFWGLGPVYATGLGYDVSQISAVMSVTMLGGFCLQWPVGRLSDSMDRRIVIVFCAAGSVAICWLLLTLQATRFEIILALLFGFGALTMSVYAVIIAHVNDTLDTTDVLPATGSLVLGYGLGAALGSACAGIVTDFVGPGGLFWFCGVIATIFATYGLARILVQRPTLSENKEDFLSVPRTTPIALQMDERIPRKIVEREVVEWERDHRPD